MTIGLKQFSQYFDRCLHKFGNEDLSMAELRDSIYIPPENLYEIQENSDITIKESLRHFVKIIFPDINAKFHAPLQQ